MHTNHTLTVDAYDRRLDSYFVREGIKRKNERANLAKITCEEYTLDWSQSKVFLVLCQQDVSLKETNVVWTSVSWCLLNAGVKSFSRDYCTSKLWSRMTNTMQSCNHHVRRKRIRSPYPAFIRTRTSKPRRLIETLRLLETRRLLEHWPRAPCAY